MNSYYIQCKIKDKEFSTRNHLVVASECRKLIPNVTQTDLIKRVLDWSWENLKNKNEYRIFQEEDIFLIIRNKKS